MKYYWLIVILIFGIKLLKDNRLSSYNIKWMLAYIGYLLWLQVDFYWKDSIKEYITAAFIIPMVSYLVFPIIWKLLSKVKVFNIIDNFIDRWYQTIKDLC